MVTILLGWTGMTLVVGLALLCWSLFLYRKGYLHGFRVGHRSGEEDVIKRRHLRAVPGGRQTVKATSSWRRDLDPNGAA